MTYLCVIPQIVKHERRILARSDWNTFLHGLEQRFPVRTAISLEEGPPGRPPAWFLRVGLRPNASMPEPMQHVLFQTISLKIDQFLAKHAKPHPQAA